MRFFLLFAALLAVLPLSSAEPGPVAKPPVRKKEELPYKDLVEFLRIMQLIREKYVDDSRVSYESLFRGAVKGMLHSLDPYSDYETPDQFSKTIRDTRGSFSGVGIVIRSAGKNIEVLSVMRDSPAKKGGILPGDFLVEAAGVRLADKSVNECVRLLQGPAGTKVKVRIYRRSTDSFLDTELVRDNIRVSSVQNAGVLPGNIAYLRITSFTQTTAADLDSFFRDHTGLEGIIVDLRNNPGGLLESAVEVCGRFLKKGTPIVSIEGRSSKPVCYTSRRAPTHPDIPMVILVNGNSASASEIFTGCMMDHKRAVSVGTRTFGKGLVQTLLSMPDKGGIRLTTARYFTPARTPIDRKGITPDITVEMTPGRTAAVMTWLLNHPDQAPSPGGIPPDTQLDRACEILKGICIYTHQKK